MRIIANKPIRTLSLSIVMMLSQHLAAAAIKRTVQEHRPGEVHRYFQQVPDVQAPGLDKPDRRLASYVGLQGLVIVARTTQCPLCLRQVPALRQLQKQAVELGFKLVYLYPDVEEELVDIRKDIGDHKLLGDVVFDKKQVLATWLGIASTTEIVVLDKQRTVRYRGAINDAFGVGYGQKKAKRQYVLEALQAIVEERVQEVAGTHSPGCLISLPQASADPAPSWHGRISRIYQHACQSCHQSGGSAPFSLTTYKNAKRHAQMSLGVVEDGIMPPWFAKGGHWRNDPRLSKSDKQALADWVKKGRPEGDPKQAPVAVEWPQEWLIGKPDLILTLPKTFTVPAEGIVEYKYQWMQNPLQEDRWITDIEIRTTAPEVVHHVVIDEEMPQAADETDEQYKARLKRDGRRFLSGIAPGNPPRRYPAGVARKLKAGQWLKFTNHYTPIGKETPADIFVGFRFTDKKPQWLVAVDNVRNTKFTIPPFANDYKVVANKKIEQDIHLLSFIPHMHLRGKSFTYELVTDDSTEVLLDVPGYDFNWQLTYRLRQPRFIQAGSILRARAIFDNSADNPYNPSPEKEIKWGDQTWEEMMIGFYEYLLPAQ